MSDPQVAYLLSDDPDRNIKIEAVEISESIPLSIPPSTPPRLPSLPLLPSPSTPPSISSSMPPPPIQVYNTPESAIAAINAFARHHGYAVSILRSKNSPAGVKKTVYLCCVRGRNSARRLAKDRDHTWESKSRSIGCPFSLTLRLQPDSDTWLLVVKNPSHNHTPSPPSTHRIHRRVELTPEIDRKLMRGCKPTDILAAVQKENPQSVLMVSDLYNRRISLARGLDNGTDSSSPSASSSS